GHLERAKFAVRPTGIQLVELALLGVVEAVNGLFCQEVKEHVALFFVHARTSCVIGVSPSPKNSRTWISPRRACVLTVPSGIPVASDISWCDIPCTIESRSTCCCSGRSERIASAACCASIL